MIFDDKIFLFSSRIFSKKTRKIKVKTLAIISIQVMQLRYEFNRK